LVHLAARVHVMREHAADPLAQNRQDNVQATLQLASRAAAEGLTRFVYISSVKVNGESTAPGKAFTEADLPQPWGPYALSKYEAERGLMEIASQTGLEVVIIRPPLVYGPGVGANFAALLRAVRRGWPLPFGAIQNRRSLVALDNLVDLIKSCVSHPAAANQIFMASDGQDLSTAELVRGMAQALCVPSRLPPVPEWALKAAGSLLGKRDVVSRLCDNLQVDISKTHDLLGWTPPLSVHEGLRRAVMKI
jgi:nucleoside-diphosphate-sugar epimerase